MKSDLPKVLHSLGGKSLVERVLDSCHLLKPEKQLVIIGYQGEKVKQALAHRQGVKFVEQTKQLGNVWALAGSSDAKNLKLMVNGKLLIPYFRKRAEKVMLRNWRFSFAIGLLQIQELKAWFRSYT